jgi:hypothetical protein
MADLMGTDRRGFPRRRRSAPIASLVAPAMLLAAVATVGIGGGGVERLDALAQLATGPPSQERSGDGADDRVRRTDLTRLLMGAPLPGEPSPMDASERGGRDRAPSDAERSSSSGAGGDSGGSGNSPAAPGGGAAPAGTEDPPAPELPPSRPSLSDPADRVGDRLGGVTDRVREPVDEVRERVRPIREDLLDAIVGRPGRNEGSGGSGVRLTPPRLR